MSWPSVIILVPAGRRLPLERRIRSLGVVPDPATGDERLHWRGCSYHLDLSGGILADYETDEVDEVAARIGEPPYAVYAACQSMDAARALLTEVLPGVDGLLDTNHHDVLDTGEFLRLLARFPHWDWRRTPSVELG